MAVCRTEGSDSAVGDKHFFSPLCNRGFAVSRGEKDHQIGFFFRKNANQELNSAGQNLHFLYEIWPIETAKKIRKFPFLRLSERDPSVKNLEESKKNVAFQARFDSNSTVRQG